MRPNTSTRDAITSRRAIEDEALRLGADRAHHENALATNTDALQALLDQARAAGIELQTFAGLAGISRTTIYKWMRKATS